MWNDAKTTLLKKRWGEKAPAKTIAQELGPGFTKNAVIGKARRLGLALRAPSENAGRPRLAQQRAQRARGEPRPPTRTIPGSKASLLPPLVGDEPIDIRNDEVVPLHARKTIATLEPDDCRWPFGTPGEPDFYFCGHERVKGLPYCSSHVRRAYIAYGPASPTSHKAKKKEEALS